MPDFERLTDKLSVDLAGDENQRQFALGFIAGKKKARLEILEVLVIVYFTVAIIGHLTGA